MRNRWQDWVPQPTPQPGSQPGPRPGQAPKPGPVAEAAGHAFPAPGRSVSHPRRRAAAVRAPVPALAVPAAAVPRAGVPRAGVPRAGKPTAGVPTETDPAERLPAARLRRPTGRLRWPPDEPSWPGGNWTVGKDPQSGSSSPSAFGWLVDGIDIEPMEAGNPLFQNPDGAPAASMPGLAGRFAAEWCPSGTSSRDNSLLRERGRTGGGVMVRRALLDRGDPISANDEALPTSQLPPGRPGQVTPHWRGAGGRWLVWVGRAVAWAVILLIGYRGIVAIINSRAPVTSASPPAATGGTPFPVTMAEAYALQFGDVYLNFSPAGAGQRSRNLARFLPAGADPELGWNGAGTQRLVDEQVAGVSVTDSHSAVVTLLARLSNGRLIELGVPVYTANGGIIVSGNPALLAGPAKATPPASSQSTDQATEAALERQLPAFFEAFASGDQTTLARFTSPGAQITGLDGAVSFGAIDSVYAPVGGSRRQISVTVTWQLPPPASGPATGSVRSGPAAVQMTYQMTVIRQQGSWDVASIGASTTPLLQGPP
jgi:hypothetical protein